MFRRSNPVALNKKKNGKQLLIIGISGFLIIGSLLSTLVFLVYQKGKSIEKNKEQVLGVSILPSQTPSATPTLELIVTPSPTPLPITSGKLKYSYDYLDINFEYPEDWKVVVYKTNNQGAGFRFDCKDKSIIDLNIKDTSLCSKDEIEPENLTISGLHGEQIILWHIDRIQASCPTTKDFKFIILGKLKTFTPISRDGKILPCYGPIIEPGTKSNWKSYRLDFITDPIYYNDIEAIIQSFSYNK